MRIRCPLCVVRLSPEIRCLSAFRETQGLAFVHVERAVDSNEIHPAWIANRDAWIDELQLITTDSPVRLENADEPFGVEVLTDGSGITVAALSWRDPSIF